MYLRETVISSIGSNSLETLVCSEKSTELSRLLNSLLGAGVLGHGLGALRHGVLGQLSWQQETDSGLDLSAGDGGAAVVVGKTGCLSSDALEDVIHKRVHDRHGLAGDSGVRVHLLQHFVDVDAVGFPPPFPALLVAGGAFRLAGGLLGSLGCCGFGWHVDSFAVR